LRGLRHRHEVRRDDFDILSARLLRKRPHAADRIVLEVGEFGRHEAVDPSFGAYFTHREHRNRRIVNTETADGERVSDVTVIGWTYFSVGSSGLRRDGPFSMSLWAVWMRRSQIASAWVDSLM